MHQVHPAITHTTHKGAKGPSNPSLPFSRCARKYLLANSWNAAGVRCSREGLHPSTAGKPDTFSTMSRRNASSVSIVSAVSGSPSARRAERCYDVCHLVYNSSI
jgi:hypothetical protein